MLNNNNESSRIYHDEKRWQIKFFSFRLLLYYINIGSSITSKTTGFRLSTHEKFQLWEFS